MNNQPTSKAKKKNIIYFDVLRATAILAVIIFHLYTAYKLVVINQHATIPSISWIITDFIASDFRFGVDLFFMISGALLLGRSTNVREFLVKKIPRITYPFVFWVLVLSVISVFFTLLIPDVWKTINPINIENYLHYLFDCFLSEGSGFTHLWFFWTILGIYLIIPLINKLILNSEMKDIEYFLVIWFITCIFEYTLNHSLRVNLTYFTGPIGLFVLGYYLRYTERKIFNNPYISLIVLILVAAVSFITSYHLSDSKSIVFFENLSVFNVIETMAIFTLIKNFNKFNLNTDFIKNPNGILHKAIISLAKYSYGIYIIHRLILAVLSKYLISLQVNYIVLLIVSFLVTLFLSWAIIMLLSKVPILKKVVN